MANEKRLNTRILLRYDEYTNWYNNNPKLLKGEVAIATIPENHKDPSTGEVTQIPAVVMKVGTGAETGSNYNDLPFVSAKAADVLAACKSETGLTAFINTVITNAKLASAETLSALDGRVTAAEGEITTLKGDENTAGSVAKAIKDAIDALSNTYVAIEDGKSLVDDDEIAKLEGVSEGANKVEASTNGNIKIDGVDTVVYTHPDKHAIAEVDGLQDALDGKQAKGDYAAEVHTHVKADITDFAHTHTASEVTDFATEVAKVKVDNAAKADEATKAIQDGNGNVIADTYAKQATTYTKDQVDDEIEGAINTFVSAYITSDGGAIDKLQEIANWIDSDKDGAADVIADVEANAEGITKLGERMDAAEDAIEAIDNHSHKNKDVIDGITAEKVTAWDGTEAAAKLYADGLNTAMNTRVEALEAIDHSHTFVESELNKIVDGDVAKWNAAEQNAKDYADDEIEALVNEGQVKTNTDAIASINDETNGILAQAKAYADGLNHEDTKYTATTDGGLKLDENNAFSIDDSITFIFDCGDSGVTA